MSKQDKKTLTDYEFWRREAEHEGWNAQMAQRLKSLVTKLRMFDDIEALRESEGSSLVLINDNPDFGGPECIVEVIGYWTEHQARSFEGSSLADAIHTAVLFKESEDIRTGSKT